MRHSQAQPPQRQQESQELASCVIGPPRESYIVDRRWQIPTERDLSFLKQESERAVASLHEGRPIIIGTYPTAVYREVAPLESFQNSRGTSKGLVAVATRCNNGQEQSLLGLPTFTLVYFPSPSDAATYCHAGAYSYRAGPADLYPGSVGTLELVFDQASGIAQITQLQSSAKIAHPSVSSLLKQPGESLCTRYQRWPSRLLELAFQHTRRMGISQIAVGPVPDTTLPLSSSVRNHSMICQKAAACGYILSKDRAILHDAARSSRQEGVCRATPATCASAPQTS
jgi:hypothetical protein